MEQCGQPETVDSAADASGRTHRLKTVDFVLPNFFSSGEIELLGGPTELGGAIVEGNVYIDGNPVSLSTFNCCFLQHSFTTEIPLCADL